LVVDFRDSLLHSPDVRRKIAQSILVGLASLDAGQRDDRVVQDPSDVLERPRKEFLTQGR
jgi:hypothetical protein